MEIDSHGVAVALDGVPVQIARGPARRVYAVWLVLRIVFCALEAMLFGHPFHHVVLMRA